MNKIIPLMLGLALISGTAVMAAPATSKATTKAPVASKKQVKKSSGKKCHKVAAVKKS